MTEYLCEEAVAGWYNLAAKLVAGMSDDDERERWQRWAQERHAGRVRHGVTLRAVETTDLWTGKGKSHLSPRRSRLATDFGKKGRGGATL